MYASAQTRGGAESETTRPLEVIVRRRARLTCFGICRLQTPIAREERMDNGTMEVATSLGLVGGGAAAGTLAGSVGGPAGAVIGALMGAVAGGIVGRRIGHMIVRRTRTPTRSLSEVLEIGARRDAGEPGAK